MAVAPDTPTEPLAHYRENRELYDSIQESLDATREYFMGADREVQKSMLLNSASFALISTQTAVRNHEMGYLNALDAETPESVRSALLDGGVNYYRNKASYILHNMTQADSDRVIDLLEEARYADALGALVDEYKGVAMQKGAFSLANLGMPKMACLDTHTAQSLDVDATDAYSGVVPEKYMKQWEGFEGMRPELRREVDSRYLYQWVLFDSNRESVTTHDAWFMSLPEDIELAHV